MRKFLIKIFPFILLAYISGVLLTSVGKEFAEYTWTKLDAVTGIFVVGALILIGYTSGKKK